MMEMILGTRSVRGKPIARVEATRYVFYIFNKVVVFIKNIDIIMIVLVEKLLEQNNVSLIQ